MASDWFRLVFSCCLSRHAKELNIPDDRSRLIPATEPSLNDNSSVAVVDHQRLKQRLDTIVRSKKGQMVNVTSELPFNLHNKPLLALDPSSSSRSESASTTRDSQSPNTPIRYQRKVRIRSPNRKSPSHSAEPSPARSRSDSSSGEDEAMSDLEEHAPHPILDVRLVRGCPHGSGIVARRGRALVRFGGGYAEGTVEREGSGDRGKGKERAHDDTRHGQRGSSPDGDEQLGSGTVDNHAGPAGVHPASSQSFISGRRGPQGQNVCIFTSQFEHF